jgi:hypothetical protein
LRAAFFEGRFDFLAVFLPTLLLLDFFDIAVSFKIFRAGLLRNSLYSAAWKTLLRGGFVPLRVQKTCKEALGQQKPKI